MSGRSRGTSTSAVDHARPMDGHDVVGPVAYDIPEVMRRLGVTRPTVYRFLSTGELRSFRLGARRLVSADALTEFIRLVRRLKRADRSPRRR